MLKNRFCGFTIIIKALSFWASLCKVPWLLPIWKDRVISSQQSLGCRGCLWTLMRVMKTLLSQGKDGSLVCPQHENSRGSAWSFRYLSRSILAAGSMFRLVPSSSLLYLTECLDIYSQGTIHSCDGWGESFPLSEFSHMWRNRSLCPLLIYQTVLKVKEYLHKS